MKTNQEYKDAALAALKGNWPNAVVASLILFLGALLFAGGNSLTEILHLQPGVVASVSGVSLLLIIFILGPLEMGLVNAFRELYEIGNPDVVSSMFRIGFGRYGHILWVYVLMEIKILLWTLLLIVPGIIKSFAYAMAPYIAIEHPEYSASECIAESEKMMKGHKFDLFWLDLSFIGWILLSIVTLGIGYFWLIPYMSTAQAVFYNDLKAGLAGSVEVTE